MGDRRHSRWSGRGWYRKFGHAFRGLGSGVRQQSSFLVHLPVAVGVLIWGLVANVSRMQWCVLTLCVAVVIGAELFNSAIETLAQAVDREENPFIRDALDMASGAVLVLSLGAAACGCLVLL